MDIDGLGEEVVDLLLDSKMIRSYADLYRLQEEEVAARALELHRLWAT